MALRGATTSLNLQFESGGGVPHSGFSPSKNASALAAFAADPNTQFGNQGGHYNVPYVSRSPRPDAFSVTSEDALAWPDAAADALVRPVFSANAMSAARRGALAARLAGLNADEPAGRLMLRTGATAPITQQQRDDRVRTLRHEVDGLIDRYREEFQLPFLRGTKLAGTEREEAIRLKAALRTLLVDLERAGIALTDKERFALADVRDMDRLHALHELYAKGAARRSLESLTAAELGEFDGLRELVLRRLVAFNNEAYSSQRGPAEQRFELSQSDAFLLVGLQLELVRQNNLTGRKLPPDLALARKLPLLEGVAGRWITNGVDIPFDVLATTPGVVATYTDVFNHLRDSEAAVMYFLQFVVCGKADLPAEKGPGVLPVQVGAIHGLREHGPWIEAAKRFDDLRTVDPAATRWDHPVMTGDMLSLAALATQKQQEELRAREQKSVSHAKVIFERLLAQAELERDQGYFPVPDDKSTLTYLGVFENGSLWFRDERFQTDFAMSTDAFDAAGNLLPQVVVGGFYASGAGCAHSSMQGVLHLVNQDVRVPRVTVQIGDGKKSTRRQAQSLRIAFDHLGQGDGPSAVQSNAIDHNPGAMGQGHGPDVGLFENLSNYLVWVTQLVDVYSGWFFSDTALWSFNGRSLGAQVMLELASSGVVQHGFTMGAWHTMDDPYAYQYIMQQAATDDGFAPNWPVLTTLAHWGGMLPNWLIEMRNRLHGGKPLARAELASLLPERFSMRIAAGEPFATVLDGVLDREHLEDLDRGGTIRIPDARLGRDVRLNLEVANADIVPIASDPALNAAQIERSQWTFQNQVPDLLPRMREMAPPFSDPVTKDQFTLDRLLAFDWTDMMMAELHELVLRDWAVDVLVRANVSVARETPLAAVIAEHHDALSEFAPRNVKNPLHNKADPKSQPWLTAQESLVIWQAATGGGGKDKKLCDEAFKRHFKRVLARAGIVLTAESDPLTVVQANREAALAWNLHDIEDPVGAAWWDLETFMERLSEVTDLADRWRAMQQYFAQVRELAGISADGNGDPLIFVGRLDEEYRFGRAEEGLRYYGWQSEEVDVQTAVNRFFFQAHHAVTGAPTFFNPYAGHDHRLEQRIATRDLPNALRRAELPDAHPEHIAPVPDGMNAKLVAALSGLHIGRYFTDRIRVAAAEWNTRHAAENRRIDVEVPIPS